MIGVRNLLCCFSEGIQSVKDMVLTSKEDSILSISAGLWLFM